MNTKFEQNILPFFATPVMRVQLDLDLEKLTDFSFQMKNRDKIGGPKTMSHSTLDEEGYKTKNINEETHEEFIKLKKVISSYVQTYHSEVFEGMKFKGNIIQNINNVWVNINEQHHYNEWHTHGFSVLSGVYYIQHDGSPNNGVIQFKHPNQIYMHMSYWPEGIIEKPNEITAQIFSIIPKPNMLIIFPAWLEHKVKANMRNDARISLSFNTVPISDSIALVKFGSASLEK